MSLGAMFEVLQAYVNQNIPHTIGTHVRKTNGRPGHVPGNNFIYRVQTLENKTLYMSLQCAAVPSYDASKYKHVGVAHEYVGNVSEGWVIYN